MAGVARQEALAAGLWAARFWTFVDKHGPVRVAALGPCWRWTGSVSKGYGQLQIGSHRRSIVERAHRLSWQLANGPVPARTHVLHRCDWPRCCRPEHLFIGDARVNAIDREQKGRGLRGRTCPGEANNHSLLTGRDVRAIKARRANGATNAELAKEFKVSASAISKAVLGRNWKHLKAEACIG